MHEISVPCSSSTSQAPRPSSFFRKFLRNTSILSLNFNAKETLTFNFQPSSDTGLNWPQKASQNFQALATFK